MARGRRSILNAVRNWDLKRKLKMDLLAGAKRSRGPGRGLDIPLADAQDPERVPIFTLALQEILNEHKELQVLISPQHLTLGYRNDFASAVAAGMRNQLETSGYLAGAGAELPVEPVPTAGAGDPRDLYTEKELRENFSRSDLERMGFSESELAALGK